MYYAQQVTNTGTVLNPIRTIEYWDFENKAQRDQAVTSNPMAPESFAYSVSFKHTFLDRREKAIFWPNSVGLQYYR